jgi:hypothetical protein
MKTPKVIYALDSNGPKSAQDFKTKEDYEDWLEMETERSKQAQTEHKDKAKIPTVRVGVGQRVSQFEIFFGLCESSGLDAVGIAILTQIYGINGTDKQVIVDAHMSQRISDRLKLSSKTVEKVLNNLFNHGLIGATPDKVDDVTEQG